MTSYSKQSIDEDDIQAVVDVLRSDYLTQGPVVTAFENELCRYTSAKHALACTNGTSALHLAMLALDVGFEDIVWTTPISFVASANAALYCGAVIDFVDIDIASFNISMTALESKLEQAALEGQLPKVVVVVHMAGKPVDLKLLKQLSEKYRFVVIEDACHALGASYQGAKIGACHYSDITVFSFHPVKSIACGEGGAVLTNSDFIAANVRLMANHGITKDPALFTNQSHGGWYYEQQALGFNYRLSDIHAALGLSQMRKLDSFIEKRTKWADWYREKLAKLPVSFQTVEPESKSAWHLFVIVLDEHECSEKSRNALYDFLVEKGVGVQVHYIPIHMQPYYSALDIQKGALPRAEELYRKSISLPLYPEMEIRQATEVLTHITDFFSSHKRIGSTID